MPHSSNNPGKHPSPPSVLNNRELPVTEVRGPWMRLFWKNKEALSFNRSNVFRFNAPEGEFGILYLGEDAHTAFIETYGWLTGEKYITMEQLAQRHLAQVASTRPMNLVDLTGKGLAKIGADSRLCMGGDYNISREWSFALWNHPRRPDGILYRTRHDPGKKAVALFNRADVKSVLTYKDMGHFLEPKNVDLLAKILSHYEFVLIP